MLYASGREGASAVARSSTPLLGVACLAAQRRHAQHWGILQKFKEVAKTPQELALYAYHECR